MAAKRKGGLKLNAICAKLSRQVVFDVGSQNAEGEQSVAEASERGSSHCEDSGGGNGGEASNAANYPGSPSLTQSLEEDQKRREAIEKWVNGEYSEEGGGGVEGRAHKAPRGEDSPPEGVYMVQPKGCSDDEEDDDDDDDDDGEEEETETLPGSRDDSYHGDDKDPENSLPKEDVYVRPSETAPGRPPPFSSPGTPPVCLYACLSVGPGPSRSPGPSPSPSPSSSPSPSPIVQILVLVLVLVL